MVLYAASGAGETLRRYVDATGAPHLARAAADGASLIRFGDTPRPEAELQRLLGQFTARFGALPPATATPSTVPPQPPPKVIERMADSPLPPESAPGLTYRDAGVDIDAGDALVERIKPHVKRTHASRGAGRASAASPACARMPTGYKEPVLVSAPTAWAPS